MMILAGREKTVFAAFAEALVPEGCLSKETLARRAREILDHFTPRMRAIFRASLFLFEWGTFFLRTRSGRFEHFSALPSRKRTSYVRLWMDHPRATVRQIVFLLKLVALGAIYDTEDVFRLIGYFPRWLC